MTVDEFIAGIPDALTPDALSRALEAAAIRDPALIVGLGDELRLVWVEAAGRAKAIAKASVDLRTPGPARDAAWAAITVAMDGVGAVAVQKQVTPGDFSRLYAPWAFMVGGPA